MKYSQKDTSAELDNTAATEISSSENQNHSAPVWDPDVPEPCLPPEQMALSLEQWIQPITIFPNISSSDAQEEEQGDGIDWNERPVSTADFLRRRQIHKQAMRDC